MSCYECIVRSIAYEEFMIGDILNNMCGSDLVLDVLEKVICLENILFEKLKLVCLKEVIYEGSSFDFDILNDEIRVDLPVDKLCVCKFIDC